MNSFPKFPVLAVDDEASALQVCEVTLRSGGIRNLVKCQDSREVMSLLAKNDYSVILLDLVMPYLSGEELLPRIAEAYPHIPVIVVTGMNDVTKAVECVKNGAFDYMVKPVEPCRMLSGVQRAIELRELKAEYESYRQRSRTDRPQNEQVFEGFIAVSTAMRMVIHYIETVAPTSKPVLVSGESGTGKELVVRAIHELSGVSGPLVAVNVASLDDTVFSDTLMGHVKGAFTGADQRRPGLIEQAAGGTLFLDEIGDLSPACQVKLLRLIQEGEYLPIGADAPKRSDVRLIVATNRDLTKLQESGEFRRDLYYRLCTHHVQLPPLRERREALPVLSEHFINKAARDLGREAPHAPRELLPLLATYAFPGNVRELEMILFEAVAASSGAVLDLSTIRKHLDAHRPPAKLEPNQIGGVLPGSPESFDTFPTLKEATEFLIREALRRADGNQGIAAQLLGISRTALNKRLHNPASTSR